MDSSGAPLRKLRLLDPSRSCGAPYIADSVRIPVTDLAARLSELPPPTETTLIANVGKDAVDAQTILLRAERPSALVDEIVPVDSPTWGRLWEPNPFLADVLPVIAGQHAIDIGSGGARDSVYLVDAGWQVVALDRLASSASLGARLADRYLRPGAAERLTFLTENALSFEAEQCFDLGLLFFCWTPSIISRLSRLIRPGGVVLVEVFTELHRREFGKPRVGFVCDEEDLCRHFGPFGPFQMHTGWHRGRHTVQAAFRQSL